MDIIIICNYCSNTSIRKRLCHYYNTQDKQGCNAGCMLKLTQHPGMAIVCAKYSIPDTDRQMLFLMVSSVARLPTPHHPPVIKQVKNSTVYSVNGSACFTGEGHKRALQHSAMIIKVVLHGKNTSFYYWLVYKFPSPTFHPRQLLKHFLCSQNWKF